MSGIPQHKQPIFLTNKWQGGKERGERGKKAEVRRKKGEGGRGGRKEKRSQKEGETKKYKYSGVNSQEARIYRSAFREGSIMTLPECQDSSEILLHTWAMLQTGKPRSPRSWALLVCMVGDSLLERTGTLHPDFFFSVETVFKEKNKEINFIKYTLTNGIGEQAQQWHQWGPSFYFIFM